MKSNCLGSRKNRVSFVVIASIIPTAFFLAIRSGDAFVVQLERRQAQRPQASIQASTQ